MTKRLSFNKINKWIIFILALLPLIFLFGAFFKIKSTEPQSDLVNSYFDSFSTSLALTNNALVDCVSMLPWFNSLSNILRTSGFLGNHSSPDFISFVYCYLNYLFEIMFLDLVFQCFTFFISLIRNFVEKLGGDF